ncbi:hypothetical protein X943_003153 [Babesia divergens]|uniref:Uncharacterized protein n=1 Tax=Babesia divergens TaxID=32595 RepID=A0AAD9LKG9_BABDI|nr:hypothetical protein X943_003153 [Babesia divergens]
MARDKFAGLTDAERAAFEWSIRQRDQEKTRRRRCSAPMERHTGKYHRSSSSDSDNPREPYNPLKLAHVQRSRRSRSPRRGKQRSTSNSPPTPDRWEHDLYNSDAEQVAIEAGYRQRKAERQATTYKVDTRRGSWRSRAGGVYLPPEEDIDLEKDLYTDYRPRRRRSSERHSRRSQSYERPGPVYTLD